MTKREMNGTLVEETKALIKEVEAGTTDRAAWIAIQDRVKRLAKGRTQTEVGRLIGKDRRWVSELLAWVSAAADSPFSAAARGRDADRNARGARNVLVDPEQREKILTSLPDRDLDEIRETAAEEMISRSRQAEGRKSTAGKLGVKQDEFTYTFDAEISKTVHRARMLKVAYQQEGPRLAMSPENALANLIEAEETIAEIRVAIQEIVQDRTLNQERMH